MKSGICPKCGSSDVWCKTSMGYRGALMLGLFTSIPLTDYVCAECGYVESYVKEDQMNRMRKSIRSHYSKVKP